MTSYQTMCCVFYIHCHLILTPHLRGWYFHPLFCQWETFSTRWVKWLQQEFKLPAKHIPLPMCHDVYNVMQELKPKCSGDEKEGDIASLDYERDVLMRWCWVGLCGRSSLSCSIPCRLCSSAGEWPLVASCHSVTICMRFSQLANWD